MGFFQRYFHRPQQLAVRRLNFQVHLWVGIILTLYMIVIGVTGSILVFRPELERLCGLKPWQRYPELEGRSRILRPLSRT